MIKGVGSDILEIERIESALKRTPNLWKRILTPTEAELYQASNFPVRFLAKRFSAKEAISKALGTGIGSGVSWQHIEILKLQSGQPRVELVDKAFARLQDLGASSVHISYSDERLYVCAFAVIE